MVESFKINDPSLVYMYGLSDFWVDMFADKQLVETVLSGETILLGEVYSYFLQRSAGISLMDIQERYETRLKLLLIEDSDLIEGDNGTSFRVDESIEGVRKISNRPILPTETLTYGIHFDIIDGVIKFYKPLEELKFPVRFTSEGVKQYALWMSDVEINEKWIENSFGRLVGFKEDDAIFNYKSFLEGVYYLYTNGPNISIIERGVNLAMGMPYARETEMVLEIFQDEVTFNWVVFTATQSYEIPYSFRPNLSPGDIITRNEILTNWVEVKDYSTSGAWWYQIYLPREVLGADMDPLTVGKATQGSVGDQLMQDFLKHHMFEVLITQPSSDITAFNTAKELVLNAKPEYTFPVFVWRATIADEIMELDDDDLTYNYRADLRDYCVSPPSRRFMNRGVEDNGFSRGTNWYNRVQGSMYMATLLGYGDWPNNGGWAPQFQTIDPSILNYLGLLMRNRGDTVSPTNRGDIIRGWRGADNENYQSLTWTVRANEVIGPDPQETYINERELTPLYMMNRTEMIDKIRTISPSFSISGRNKFIIKGLNPATAYDTWMIRNDSITPYEGDEFDFQYSEGDLDIAFSPFANQTYVPSRAEVEGAGTIDLFLTRSTNSAWVCQWIRRDIQKAPTLFPVEDSDLTKAIEEYTFDDDYYKEYGVGITAGFSRVQTPRLVNGTEDLFVIVDGLYVSTFDYNIDFENTEAELPRYEPSDPATVELPIVGRTYLELLQEPAVGGYMAYDDGSGLPLTEEFIVSSGTGVYTLSQSVSNREDILVIENGNFIFNYAVAGNTLNTSVVVGDIFVRYTNHRDEQSFSAGRTEIELAEDSYCKIFLGNKLLEDWQYSRNGTTIKFPSPTTDTIRIRYTDQAPREKLSPFTRRTVEDNQARFLMDRSRVNGEYDDYIGQTVFFNRSGTPTKIDTTDADYVNVVRRLQ